MSPNEAGSSGGGSTVTLRRVGRVAAYGAGGFVGTAIVALLLLNLTQPLQRVVYDAVYLQLGPSEATTTAILSHFLVAAVAALAVPLVVGDYLSDRLANRRVLAGAVAGLAGALLAFLAVALAGLGGFLSAIVVLGVVLVGIPVILRVRYGIRSGGLTAFVGGVPVVLLLLVAAAFGIGWGWGYVVTAEEVSTDSVNDTVVTFEDAPVFERDLFAAGHCEVDPDGQEVCRLSLRGYDGERAAARVMARHGVRCPYQNGPADSGGAFFAQHGNSTFRITCSPHGD